MSMPFAFQLDFDRVAALRSISWESVIIQMIRAFIVIDFYTLGVGHAAQIYFSLSINPKVIKLIYES